MSAELYAYTESSFRAIGHPSEAVAGETVVDEIPASFYAPKFDVVVAAAIYGVQAWLDSTAQQNGYDGAVSCASYANSGVARYKADATAMINWRDAVWVAANAWRNSLGGQIPSPVPTIEQIIAQLPKPQTFGWTVHGEGAGSETGEMS